MVSIVELAPDEWRDFKELRLRALRTEAQAFWESHSAAVERPDAEWSAALRQAAEADGPWLRFARVGDRLVGMLGLIEAETTRTQRSFSGSTLTLRCGGRASAGASSSP